MKSFKCLIALVVLLIVNGILIYNLKLYSNAINSIDAIFKKNEQGLLVFEHNFIKEQENENLVLNDSIKFINIEGNIILAKDLFKTNAVILRYSESNCEDCIKSEINTLIKSNSILKKDLYLLTSYQNRRDLFIYYNQLKERGLKKIKVFLIKNNGLNIPVEELNMPYYFCINSNLIMSNFFIPQKENSKLSENYLKAVTKNLY